MKYDLQRLGPLGLQDVVAALTVAALGAHVRPMGRGRDGGRDMLVNGRVVWGASEGEPAEVWRGKTVFQVKHKAMLEGPQKDAAWIWDQIRQELDRWALDTGRAEVPDYLVFVTNVPLTPTPTSGGFDTINRRIADYLAELRNPHAEDHLSGKERVFAHIDRGERWARLSRLREWRIWDAYQLDGLLDAHAGVRRAFDGFLTAGDVLADLSSLSTSLSLPELGMALREHARWALIEERNIYFDEAGGDTRGVSLEQVVIDLPVHVSDSEAPERVIRYVLDRGDHVLSPSTATLRKPRHLLVAGAPGNGKTTASKFLVQAYRAALLSTDQELADQHRDTIAGTAAALDKMGCFRPSHRRWPFRVDLAEFAKRKATDPHYTLLAWLADTLSSQVSVKSVPRWALWSWLQAWPSFLVLDGLDEVTEPIVRKGLIADVQAFVADAEAKDCDMLALVTTRPIGYSDEMDASVFERVDLAELPLADALSYGRLVTRLRIPNDEIRRSGVDGLLAQAANDEALRHLLRTPLQVLIMSIIAETSRQFSPSRFALFWRYYQVIEAREQTKPVGFSALLRDHAPQILDLHRRVGLMLQQQAEESSGATAVLSAQDLHDVAWQVLTDAEYKPSTTHAPLLSQILTAVTHRLVLLTPRGEHGYGFEIRSLQELMASLELTTGTLEQVLPRLRLIAASPHWRNTWLFAAGRYFADPQPAQHEALSNLVLNIDHDASYRLGAICPIGPELAWEIVDDGMTASVPKWLNRFVGQGMVILEGPEPSDLQAFTRVLVRAASSQSARELIRERFQSALRDIAGAGQTIVRVQELILTIGKEMGASREVMGLAAVTRDPTKSESLGSTPDWEAFDAAMSGYATDRTRETLAAVADAIRKFAVVRGPRSDSLVRLVQTALLERPDVAEVLEEALLSVAGGSPSLVASLRDYVLPVVWRQPVNVWVVPDDF